MPIFLYVSLSRTELAQNHRRENENIAYAIRMWTLIKVRLVASQPVYDSTDTQLSFSNINHNLGESTWHKFMHTFEHQMPFSLCCSS